MRPEAVNPGLGSAGPSAPAARSRRRKLFWRVAVYTPLAAIVLVILLHPYSRQSLFGPKIQGEPVWFWKERFRHRASGAANQRSLFTRLTTFVGLPSAPDVTASFPFADPAMQAILIELLEDEDWRVRREAVLAVARPGLRAEARDALLRRLDDPAPEVREMTACVMLGWRADVRPALPRLRRMLDDPDPPCRVAAAELVWTVGKQPDLALPVLRRALQDPTALTRCRALAVVERLGDEAHATLPDIVPLATTDPDKNVRVTALSCLGNFGPPAVPALRAALRDPDAQVRLWSATALARIGPPARDAVPELRRLLADPAVRDYAAEALSRIDPMQFPRDTNKAPVVLPVP
jgi:HEAT repeats